MNLKHNWLEVGTVTVVFLNFRFYNVNPTENPTCLNQDSKPVENKAE